MLKITQGDDKSFGVQLPGNPDLTGCTVFFTAKREEDIATTNATDSNAVIKAQESAHSHPSAAPTTGKTVITLSAAVTSAAATGIYLYDIQLKHSGGKIRTYKKANGKLMKCEVTPQATQRTS